MVTPYSSLVQLVVHPTAQNYCASEDRSHVVGGPGSALVAARPCADLRTPAFRRGARTRSAVDGNRVARRSGSLRGYGYVVERVGTSFQMVVAAVAADRMVGRDLCWRENSPAMTDHLHTNIWRTVA